MFCVIALKQDSSFLPSAPFPAIPASIPKILVLLLCSRLFSASQT